MTDISVFTVEERLIAAVWVHDRIRNDMTMEDIRSAFTKRFGKPAASRSNLYLWEKYIVLGLFGHPVYELRQFFSLLFSQTLVRRSQRSCLKSAFVCNKRPDRRKVSCSSHLNMC